jgi:ElaB/YqjD/DUF883 family membrane-anchored ribosome-binding protein
MKADNLASKFDSVTMSPTARERMSPNRSKNRFLAEQVADARNAMIQTVHEMKRTLARAADVRTCARQHPWIATGSAVAAGFVVGAILPTLRPTSDEKSAKTTDADVAVDSTGHGPERAKSGLLLATLGTVLAGLAKTLLQEFITAAVVATEGDQVKVEPPTPSDATSPGTPKSATP